MTSQIRKELIQFFGWTFIFSWIIWLPGVLSYLELILIPKGVLTFLKGIGAIGPAVIALILTRHQSGKPGAKQLWISSFNIKSHWKFWVLASLMLMALHAVSQFILSLISSDLPQSTLLQSPVAILPMFVVMFLIGGGLGEEIGWRGYCLDRFQTHYNALLSSLILSIVWIVWHLPLFFYGGTNQSLIPF